MMKQPMPLPRTVDEMGALLAESLKADILRGIVTAARRHGLTDAEIDAVAKKTLALSQLALTAEGEFPFSVAEALEKAKLVVHAHVAMAKSAERP